MKRLFALLAVVAALAVGLVAAPTASAMDQGTANYWLSVDAALRCQQVLGSACSYSYITGLRAFWGTYAWTATATYVRLNAGGWHGASETLSTGGTSTQEWWNTGNNLYYF